LEADYPTGWYVSRYELKGSPSIAERKLENDTRDAAWTFGPP
jgi:hypothetical protein